MHSGIIVEHEGEKESAIITCVFSLVLAYVSGYIFVCICMFLYVYVSLARVWRQSWSPVKSVCVTVSMCRRGVGVGCVLVCRRPWMLSRLQLGTAMVHVQCRKQQEQATYKLNSHTLKTSAFPLASSSMSSRAIKQAIAMCILLGCQSEQGVQGISRFIWILNFFQINCFIYIYDWFDSSVK